MKDWLTDRLRLAHLSYEFPFFNAAVALGLIAAVLRIVESLEHGQTWTAHAGLPIALALLCLLMLRAYPHRGWVHGALGLTTLAVAMLTAPHLTTPVLWLLTVMALAQGSLLASRGARRVGPICGDLLGIEPADYHTVPNMWSVLFFAIGSMLTGGLVIGTTLQAVFGLPMLPVPDTSGWSGIMLTLALAALYVVDADLMRPVDEQVMGLYLVLALGVWWLGASSSPVVLNVGVSTAVYFPLATALMAVATVLLGPLVAGMTRVGLDRSERLNALAWKVGSILAVAASVFTLGLANLTTVATLFLATAALGVPALERGRLAPAYASGTTWCAAVTYAAWIAARPVLGSSISDSSICVALALTVALFGLCALTGVLRGRSGHEPTARALEQVALVAAWIASIAVAFSHLETGSLGNLGVLLGAGILMALALIVGWLAGRWRSEALVYLAQALLLGGYFSTRSAFSLSPATDALLLTLFGAIDLGIAEVMQRLRLHVYARPTLYCALGLPIVALVRSLWGGPIADVNLFFLFSAGTFYGVACIRTRWKTLGYVAAVLYNALLWLVWGRVGFQLADHPQFFLIPVGFSSILFAEVNRREFGPEYVNAIRALGLSVVYLSLAFPIWQTQSFGAWVTLLLLSLAGVFIGIGLRAQSFLWLGLIGFVLDVVYQLGRLGAENSLAKWGIMLALGIALFLFVALNEKKRIVVMMKRYYEEARSWE